MANDVEQQAVYVLNRRAYQETSLIVDVFSLEHGRLSVVAKGAMRSKKNWSALLQAFQPLLMSWTGRSTLKTLKSLDVPSAPLPLTSKYLYCAYYLNELVIKLVPEFEVNASIFSSYVSALDALNEQKYVEAILRKFELELLIALGLAPDFCFDASGHEICENSVYGFKTQHGFERVPDHRYQNGSDGYGLLLIEGRNIARLYQSTSESGADSSVILKIENRDFYRQSKALMRILIDRALGGREIKTRELFKQIKY